LERKLSFVVIIQNNQYQYLFKMEKYVIFSIFAFMLFACGAKEVKTDANSTSETTAVVDGAKIYKQNCELCHGRDGKLGANASKDLTVSALDLNARIALVSKGAGVMMAFENILNPSEIIAVSEYTMTLK
jgi:cytochrome c6